jgi:hypothetical protein
VIPTVDLSGGFTAAGKPPPPALLSVRNPGVEFRQAVGKIERDINSFAIA